MTSVFRRTGALKELSSYPAWLQQVVSRTNANRGRVSQHQLFMLIRDARLPAPAMRKFMVGAWPTIEQFPQFMAMNLKKVNAGDDIGRDMARRYLIHNIRVEQKHAEYWVDWANASGISLDELKAGHDIEGLAALAHWCWYVCDKSPLPVAIAATNYAVEGVTADWSTLICSQTTYAESLPAESRNAAMRWLRLHAQYDDSHPWEALDIVATLLGNEPKQADVDAVERAIRSTYVYFEMGLDHALADAYHAAQFDETASNASTLGALDAA